MSVPVLDDGDPDQAAARDMLVHAELHVGGQVGVGTDAALGYLRASHLIGAHDGLTERGVRLAITEQRKHWSD